MMDCFQQLLSNSTCSKLLYDALLSTVAIKFNLRRYILEVLKWAIDHGCRWNKKNLLRTARSEITRTEECRIEFAKNEEAVLRMSAAIEGYRRMIEYVQSLDGDGR